MLFPTLGAVARLLAFGLLTAACGTGAATAAESNVSSGAETSQTEGATEARRRRSEVLSALFMSAATHYQVEHAGSTDSACVVPSAEQSFPSETSLGSFETLELGWLDPPPFVATIITRSSVRCGNLPNQPVVYEFQVRDEFGVSRLSVGSDESNELVRGDLVEE